MNQTVQNKALITRLFEGGLAGRNINVFDELCAPTFVDHDAGPADSKGALDDVKAMFRGVFEAFPEDLRIILRNGVEKKQLLQKLREKMSEVTKAYDELLGIQKEVLKAFV